MKKYVLIVFFLIAIVFLLVLLVRSKSVFWQDNNNSKIKLISRVNLSNFYRSIGNKGFQFVLISYKDQPRLMLNNLPTTSEIFAYNNERRLLWQCYWNDTFFKLLNLKIPIKKKLTCILILMKLKRKMKMFWNFLLIETSVRV